MKPRLLLALAALAALAGGSILATPAPAPAACTHADGVVSVNVCADPAEPGASVRICSDTVRIACRDIGTRDR